MTPVILEYGMIEFPFPAMCISDSTSFAIVKYSQAINNFERKFLELLSYNVTVSSSLYAKYYFELRSLCEANMRKFGLKPLSSEQAKRLEAGGSASSSMGGAEAALKETHSAMTTEEMKPARRSRAVIS
jgi:hypothetical protein